MRRIDKTEILSTQYKKWVDNLDGLQEEHPPDSRKYRVDVIMNLLYCQKGVCAYTEMLIIDPSSWSKDSWLNGRYKEKERNMTKQNRIRFVA